MADRMQALLQYQGQLKHVDHAHRIEPRHVVATGSVSLRPPPFQHTLSKEKGEVTRFYQADTSSWWEQLAKDLKENANITLRQTPNSEKVDWYLRGYYWDTRWRCYRQSNQPFIKRAVLQFWNNVIKKAHITAGARTWWPTQHDRGLYMLLDILEVEWDRKGYEPGSHGARVFPSLDPMYQY